MAVRMQQRRATAEQWLLADPILEPGEIGYETDTNSFKIGDGINNWSLLDYFETSTALQGTIDDYIPLTQKGAALGVAELDANGFVPVSQLGNIIDSAPEALDTLNELAAALSDDANAFSTLTAYADQAEADAKAYADGLASNYDAAGSASTAESNANSYTDSLIGDGTVDGTAGNTVTDRIATAVANLVDSAPGVLDTLNELAAAIGDDANFVTTINNSLDLKSDKTSLAPHPFAMVI